MDFLYLVGAVLFFGMVAAMAVGCAALGKGRGGTL